MFAQASFSIEPLQAEELDLYLSKGWFRMHQYIFTCTYIPLNDQVYRVYWLRVLLDQFDNDKTLKRLCRLNSKFTVKIQKASITPEKEALYSTYQTGITFNVTPTLEQLLFDDMNLNIYNTLEIDVYDKGKLIGLGYFDIGKNSAAGITSFYDPAYKKFSLGKYMIYQKMLYCKAEKMKYYYLGYFAPGSKAFDYKLDIAKDALEYFDLPTQKWFDIKLWDSVSGSIEENRRKLISFQQQLDKVNIKNRLFRYPYFQANLYAELQGYELFDYYLFVYCFDFSADAINPLVVYDLRNGQYHLLKCQSVGKSDGPEMDTELYSFNLLKIEAFLYSTPNEKKMAEMVSRGFLKGRKVGGDSLVSNK
ncbi:MAG: arginyl-tRNA--protein arginylyltransferase [Cytophagaceae bacterium]